MFIVVWFVFIYQPTSRSAPASSFANRDRLFMLYTLHRSPPSVTGCLLLFAVFPRSVSSFLSDGVLSPLQGVMQPDYPLIVCRCPLPVGFCLRSVSAEGRSLPAMMCHSALADFVFSRLKTLDSLRLLSVGVQVYLDRSVCTPTPYASGVQQVLHPRSSQSVPSLDQCHLAVGVCLCRCLLSFR